jgi:sterol-4alpha-carboxylate 3-dehydrogenase (decarboxylating)
MLGYAIAEQLHAAGKTVRILDLQPVNDDRFESLVGDIRNPADLENALRGMEVVFQCAAVVWDPKLPANIFEEVNVQGNRNVIQACLALGVGKLIYTSSIDVVVDGAKAITNGDESLPYPKDLPKDPYCRTKIVAEQMMCQASCETLKICCLRPVGIYGPRDRYHLPNILAAARGPVNFRLGDGSARFSHIYSENAAYAQILAAKHLGDGSPLPGNIYFVADRQTNENLFDFMAPFLVALGYKPPRLRIPYRLAYFLSWLAEKINPQTTFCRFAVIQTCVDHTYIAHKAARDFGYQPPVGAEEAFRRTVAWFRENWDH